MRTDYHVFKGLRRDTHPIKQNAEYLWGANNIRLTAREGSTFMSITNEKSTQFITDFDNEEYVGYVTCGNYLVLFTHTEEYDTIHRFDLDTLKDVILYRGNLNFNIDNPIQAISDFESELIQKVYWTDGINRPRVINIKKPELILCEEGEELPEDWDFNEVYTDAPFDFVQELQLNEEVTVKRINGSVGIFQPGVIQYAFTYFHKYGQESNIFYVTEPMYVAFPDRGGAADQSISTAFELNIKGLETKFKYLRIYSILRTSLNSVPTVKRIKDVELTNTEVTVVDNNTVGDTIDPTLLLYVGGKDILAQCIHNKDGVLFLGNIKYKREELSVVPIDNDVLLREKIKESKISCNNNDSSFRTIVVTPDENWEKENTYNLAENAEFGNYLNQLSANTSTFKVGETYRLGVQFQYKNGEWSEPLWLSDKVMNTAHPELSAVATYAGNRWEADYKLSLPCFESTLDNTIINSLKDNYYKVRPVIAVPDYKDRTVLAQGIICPTVYNLNNRLRNSPYAQSSWFLRPYLSGYRQPADSLNPYEGEEAEYRHNFPVAAALSRRTEIQNSFIEIEGDADGANIDGSIWPVEKPAEQIKEGSNKYNSLYYVDQSILTFHSPDLVFNESLRLVAESGVDLKMRIVGVVPFHNNYGDIDVQVASETISSGARGFLHQSTSGGGEKSLISGLFYEDAMVNYKSDNSISEFYEYESSKTADGEKISSLAAWMVYLWHRSGSLNNDVARGQNLGTRTAELRKKKISNIKYSRNTSWLNNIINLRTSKIALFDSNEVSLVKIKSTDERIIKDEDGNQVDITYYGNVDTLNASGSPYKLVYSQSTYKGVDYTKPWSFTLNAKYNGKWTVIGTGTAEVSRGASKWVTNIKEWKRSDELSSNSDYATITSMTFGGFIRVADSQYYDSFNNKIEFASGISIDTDCYIRFKAERYSGDTISSDLNFRGELTYLMKDSEVGKQLSTLKRPKDAVRIKYKSTPHLVFAHLDENNQLYSLMLDPTWWLKDSSDAFLYMAELYQEVPDTVRYGGTTDEALRNNLWIPAGHPVRLDSEDGVKLKWIWGDTWYQRYDLMKTYPFTNEDENQMVEIASFMCESRVNLDGRTDRNRFQKNNLDMSPQNFNLMNDVYSQLNNFFNYRILDRDFYKVNTYPSQMLWTLLKTPASDTDNWTNLYSANTLDFDGTHGPLNAITSVNDLLVGFQDTAVNNISFNARVEIQASDGVPIELANSGRVDGYTYLSSTIGCKDKFDIQSTSSGIYFHDSNSDAIYNIGEGLQNLSLVNNTLFWPRDNHPEGIWKFGRDGIRIDYDPKYGDVYFIPGDSNKNAFCYSEHLNEFISEYSYGGAVMFPYASELYSLATDTKSGKLSLWKNFKGEGYNNIFNTLRGFDFSFISNEDPQYTKIFDTIEMRTDTYRHDNIVEEGGYGYMDRREEQAFESQPYDYIRVTNEYQDSGKSPFNELSLRKKFRVWRGIIPRQKEKRDRIMNTWCKITLGKDNPSVEDFTILHDIGVKYTN